MEIRRGAVLRAIPRSRDARRGGLRSGKGGTSRGALTGFGIMEFGDERAHLVLLAVRPPSGLGIGQRLLEWIARSARCAGMASIQLELRAANDAARRFYRRDASTNRSGSRYYRSGEGRKKAPCACSGCCARPAVPYTWRPRAPKTPRETIATPKRSCGLRRTF